MGQRLLKKHSKFQYFIEARLGSGTRFYMFLHVSMQEPF